MAALTTAAAQPAWLDVWAAVWGVLLARPDVLSSVVWARMAAVGVVVWLLTWARDLEPDDAEERTAPIPGGRRALTVAGLSVAAVLGMGPFVAAAAWLGLGILRPRFGAPDGVLIGRLRVFVGALGAWLSLGGLAAARAGADALSSPSLSVGWLQANGVDVAIILMGCSLAVGTSARTRWHPPSRLVRGVAWGALVIGWVAADRPGGLWLAALCAATLWSPRSRNPLPGAGTWERTWLPIALAAACGVDYFIA